MANINLLPWREHLRQQKTKTYLICVGISAIVAVCCIILTGMFIDNDTQKQNNINKLITDRMSTLDLLIIEIKDLETQKQELVQRMKAIYSLQGNRPIIVHLFDELAKIAPDGLYYVSLNKVNKKISLQGISDSNNHISKLMRSFDNSKWFSDPNLTAVKAVDAGNEFNLTVKINMNLTGTK